MRIRAQKNENLFKRVLHRPFVHEPFGASLVLSNPAGADQQRSAGFERRIRAAPPRRILRGDTGWEIYNHMFL